MSEFILNNLTPLFLLVCLVFMFVGVIFITRMPVWLEVWLEERAKERANRREKLRAKWQAKFRAKRNKAA